MTSSAGPNAPFHTTQWSLILQAQGSDRSARAALDELCRQYWSPAREFVVKFMGSAQEAEDLTQAFFTDFLERESWGDARRDRGRFRSFLRGCLRHFLLNQRRQADTQKAKAIATVPLDASADASEPAADAFELRWARTLLDTVHRQLRERYHREGKGTLFEALRGVLTSGGVELTAKDLGAEIGLEPGAVRVAAHRLRQRFSETLRQEVAKTIADPADVEEEIRDLFRAFAAPES